MKDLDTAELGHNKGPAFNQAVVDAFMGRAKEIADAAGEWVEAGEIETTAQAEKVNDFLSGARLLFKESDERRKLEKQPHLEAGRDIDAAFKKVAQVIEASAKMVKPLLSAFMLKRDEEDRARREAEAKAAEEDRKAAEKAAAEAEARNDVAGMVEAESRAEEAKEAEAEAKAPVKTNVKSATGGGKTQALRTVRTAELTSLNSAMIHYRDRPEMAELLLRLANADIRAAKGAEITIPGITVKTERKI